MPATVAKYAAEGIRGVLVCCTGGEEGEILNPAVDTPEVREPTSTRSACRSSQDSVDAIGYEQLYMLGYRDSGMKDTEPNAQPGQLRERAARRSGRAARAHHPRRAPAGDHHLRRRQQVLSRTPTTSACTRSRGPAFDAAGDPNAFPDAGEPWQPSKMYYTGWSARRIRALHDAFIARGEESPYAHVVRARGFDESRDERFTTFVDVERLPAQAPRGAARAPHAGRPDRVLDAAPRRRRPRGLPVGGVRARALAGRHGVPEGEPEDDLFAGLRATGAHLTAIAAPRGSAMSKYLSQEWIDETRALAEGQPERPGASARMQYVVTGGPGRRHQVLLVLEDGKLLESCARRARRRRTSR